MLPGKCIFLKEINNSVIQGCGKPPEPEEIGGGRNPLRTVRSGRTQGRLGAHFTTVHRQVSNDKFYFDIFYVMLISFRNFGVRRRKPKPE